jgi:hypothetical protein
MAIKDRNLTPERPILVTGSPRSGTTWVGRILAEAPRIRYIHEPFNISAPPCRCGVKLDSWFYYATAEDFALRRHLQHLLSSPTHPINLLNALEAALSRHRRKEGLKKLKTIATSLTKTRPLVKDPLALFSAEWLVAQFDMVVIVLIRHPAAIVSSYKELNWSHPFSHFLQQPQLLDDCLSLFADEIAELAGGNGELIDQVSLLWRLIHFQIHRYQLDHPDWIFMRYEDLASDPFPGFGEIFQQIGLPLTGVVEQTIAQHSSVTGQKHRSNPYRIRRDSKTNVKRWKQRLTAAEIRHIKRNVSDVSPYFYTDEEW